VSGIYTVAPGAYRGTGTWTDSTGRSGTLTDVTLIETLPDGNLRNTETATYSDGSVQQFVVTYVHQGGSRYDVTVDVNGQSFVIGNGACGPTQCATQLNTPAGQYIENTDYSQTAGKRMWRSGGFSNATTGVWTFYRFYESAR
jgi:hypothetical protein